jgi:hypothetical protein
MPPGSSQAEVRMKFRVTGENVNTSARMAMEIDAASKAEAERKAFAAGMKVHRASVLTQVDISEANRTRRRATGMHPVVKFVLFGAVIAAAWYFAWPKIQPMLGR